MDRLSGKTKVGKRVKGSPTYEGVTGFSNRL